MNIDERIERDNNASKQYDTVLLKDGRSAAIVEAFENGVFIADVGSSPKDWETIDITIDDVEKVIHISENYSIAYCTSILDMLY